VVHCICLACGTMHASRGHCLTLGYISCSHVSAVLVAVPNPPSCAGLQWCSSVPMAMLEGPTLLNSPQARSRVALLHARGKLLRCHAPAELASAHGC
jgi:hypothetical protein